MRIALSLVLAASVCHAQTAPPPTQAPVVQKLDDGRLDPAWFGPEVKLAPGLLLDFVWIKPGTSLKGKHLQMLPWQFGVLLDPNTDARDQVSAGYLTQRMPQQLEQYLRSLWGEGVEVDGQPGDFQLVGRIVDTSIQSIGGRFFMGFMAAQSLTWDLKILDHEGNVIAAAHHRWGVPGGQDLFRSLGEARVFADLRPFAEALAPLSFRMPAWPTVIELKNALKPAMVSSSEASSAVIRSGWAAPTVLRGKTLKVAPWRVSEEEYSEKTWEYGACAEQTAAQLTQAFSTVAPAPGTTADFTLRGVLRVKKDSLLYQASLVDAEGKEVFRMDQARETDRAIHLEGRDPEFVRVLITQLTSGEGGFHISPLPLNPPSLLPPEAVKLAKDDRGVWISPGLNLNEAHIELAPWNLPSAFVNVKPKVWIHAYSAVRALPGILGASFVQASRGNTNGIGTLVSVGATHRLEGQIVEIGKEDLGVMEARLVEIATGRTVWAMRMNLDEASGRDDQAHDSMEQFVDKEVLPFFPASLYSPVPAAH